MKKAGLALIALSALGFSIQAQRSASDIERLRDEIGLPQTTAISTRKAPLTASGPFRIFLAIRHNEEIARDFEAWVADWNIAGALQYGRLEIVDDIEKADLAVTQYRFGVSRFVREDAVGLKLGKAEPAGEKRDEFVLARVGSSPVYAKSTARSLLVPVYSYLVTRGPRGWNINYSRADDSFSDENPFPDRRLLRAIEDLLKGK